MKRIIENLKVWLWMLTKGRKIRQAYDALQNRRAQLRLHDSWDTIKQIVTFKSSISRFGDGELQIMHRYLSEQKMVTPIQILKLIPFRSIIKT